MTDKQRLDKILKHSKFNHKTKALWAYYRGNGSVETFARHCRRDRVMKIILLNLHLNGALEERLGLFGGDRQRQSYRDAMLRVVEAIRPTTHAHWKYAIRLIDIAKSPKRSKSDDKPARPKGY